MPSAIRPSWTLWLSGFSTYTSLPASHAQIVISECQWLHVATDTASRFLSASASRISATVFGKLPESFFTFSPRDLKSRVSGSIK